MKITFSSQNDFNTTHRVDNVDVLVNVEDRKVTLDIKPNTKEIFKKQLFKEKILEILDRHPISINLTGVDKNKLVNDFIPYLMRSRDLIDYNDTKLEEVFDEIDMRLKKLLNYYFLKNKRKNKIYKYENNI